MSGTLYVVATPIGNLDDLSARAVSALRDATTVVAEDTRRTRQLLAHLELVSKPLRRIDANAGEKDIASVVDLLAAGETIALCTDAGTPGVSDPGAALVTAARAAGVRIVPIPGASAVTAALSASGYAFASFRFVGFLPRGGMERARAVAELTAFTDAIVFFESPQRMGATLEELARAMPERRATIARELTKLHEEIVEGTLLDLAKERAATEFMGELTIVLAPWQPPEELATDEDVERRIDEAFARGMRPREIAERVALETGRRKKDVYDLVLRRKK